MKIREYFESLAANHKAVKHSDEEPHFASSLDDAATLMARRLYYPAVFLNEGDLLVTGQAGNELVEREYSMAFVEHVQDAGNKVEIEDAFDREESIMMDFIAKMVRDKHAGMTPVTRFTAIGAEGHRVELVEAGLYGWILLFNLATNLCTVDNHNFE